MTVPIAHAGHWIVNTLYAMPVIVLVLALIRQRRVEARREAEELKGISGSAHADRVPDLQE